MTQTQFDPVQQREITQRATACVAFALSKDSHLRPAETPEDDIKRRGFSRYLSSKNADPLLTTDEGFEAPLNAALLTQVDQRSLIGQLIALGASRLGLSESLRLQVATVSATVVAESEPLEPRSGSNGIPGWWMSDGSS